MTDPHPQSTERCGHFEVCFAVYSRRLHPGICPFDEKPQNSKTGKCKHDTRPHTPVALATEPKPLRYSGVTVFTPPELSRHDAAIRKAEREQVLNALEEFLNSDDHLSLFKWEVREQIRSLRCGATDEGGERR